jgi:hypothetical protein
MIVFQGGDDGRGYRNMYKTLRGLNSNHGDWYLLLLLLLGIKFAAQHSTVRCINTVQYCTVEFRFRKVFFPNAENRTESDVINEI